MKNLTSKNHQQNDLNPKETKSDICLKSSHGKNSTTFGTYYYSVKKIDEKIIITANGCIEVNMPFKINRAFKRNQYVFPYDVKDPNGFLHLFKECNGSMFSDLIFGIDIKDVFPDLKNSWPVKSAYSSDIYCPMGSINMKGKVLLYCLKITLSGSMILYVFEPEHFSNVIFLIDEPYCLHLRTESLNLKVISEVA